MRFYINGELAGELTTSFTANASYPLRIGSGRTESSNADYLLPGQVAEVRVWNKVRTATKIKADMKQSLTGKESGLVGYWPLDSQLVLDRSSNSNNGTVHGASVVTVQDLSLQPAKIFDADLQSQFMENFGNDLASNLKDVAKTKASGTNQGTAVMNPTQVLDTLKKTLSGNGIEHENEFLEAIEELKDDPDILKGIKIWEDSLNGNANLYELEEMVKPPTNGASSDPTQDAGLNGQILTGEIDEDGTNDLIRFSGYMSGAGSTFGVGVSAMPSTFHDLATNAVPANSLRKYLSLRRELKKVVNSHNKVQEMITTELNQYSVHPEDGIKSRGRFNFRKTSGSYSLNQVQNLPDQKSKLLSEAYVTKNRLTAQKQRFEASVEAKSKLGKIGTGIKGASAAFGGIMGGVNAAAGAQSLENAKQRLKNNEITQAQYDEIERDANLKIAEGALGIGDGMYNLGELVAKKLGPKIAQKVGAKVGSTALKSAARFVPVAGAAVGVAMGVVSLTQNSIAADNAVKSGNAGRAAMYAVCGALDVVSIALDIASLVCDFVPGIGTAVSFVLDVVNTVVSIVSTVIASFAEMVDTRDDKVKIQESFDEYVESQGFKDFIKQQAEVYKEQGYDVFEYIIDAKAAGVGEENEDFDNDELSSIHTTVQEALTAKAKENINDPNARLALVDGSSIGRELKGRLNDDMLRAGIGADTLHGDAGDDLLFGEEGDDVLYGDEGNDFLDGGTDRDKLFGGEGDDWLRGEPGIDLVVDGGPGTDTLEISTKNWNYYKYGTQNVIQINSPGVHGVYVDLAYENSGKHGRMGICLGSMVEGLAGLNTLIHELKPAFESGTNLETKLKTLFWNGQEDTLDDASSLDSKMLWLLASEDTSDRKLKYITDGEDLYAQGRKGSQTAIWKANFDIANISENILSYTEGTISSQFSGEGTYYNITYTAGKELEALFFVAFRGAEYVTQIEKVTEERSDQDIRTQVIGSNDDNLIDIGYGYNESVYTRGGNNVVSMASSYSPHWDWMNYIIGGDGRNTLIINSSNRSTVPRYQDNGVYDYDAGHLFVLLDHDTDPATAKKDSGLIPLSSNQIWSSDGQKVDRGIYLKSIQTIQLNAKQEHNSKFCAIAVNLKEGHKFIIDSDVNNFWLAGTQGDDTIYIQNLKNTNNSIDGYAGTNLLSMEYCDLNSVNIDLANNTVDAPNFLTRIYNIQNVKGSPGTNKITGNQENNLLVVYGGSCTVKGVSGDNTLYAMRGRHTLQGGDGNDTYVLEGPEITELTTITVVNDKDNGIVAQSSGSTSWSNGQLTINLLSRDVNDITLKTAQIVDKDNAPITSGKGQLTKSGNQLIFRPNSDFSTLKRGESETIRVQYITEGSSATIQEVNVANKIVLNAFSNVSELKVKVSSNGDLEFCDLQDRLIFTDQAWGDLNRDGITNLNSLVLDFVNRFPMIQLKKTDQLLEETEIVNLLFDQLKSLVSQPGSGLDTLIDAKDITTSQLSSSKGNNTILATKKNMTYTLGGGNDLIDASEINQHSGSGQETIIRTGDGEDAVIIGDNPVTIKIYFRANNIKQGRKALIVKGINPNQLGITQNNNVYSLSHSNRTIAILDALPDFLVFEQNEEFTLIPDVQRYVEERKQSRSYNVLAILDDKQELKLQATDYSQNDIKVGIAPTDEGVEIQLVANNQAIYKFPVEWFGRIDGNDANFIASICQTRFKRGIQFRDATLTKEQVGTFILNKLQSASGHLILGTTATSTQESAWQSYWNTEENYYRTQNFSSQNIAINNPSFEAVSTAAGKLNTNNITGWTLAQSGAAATYGSGTDVDDIRFSQVTPEGRNCVVLAQSTLSQTLTTNFSTSSDYRLTVYLGAAVTIQKAEQFEVRLLAGSTLLENIDQTAFPLSSSKWHKFVVYGKGEDFATADGQALKIEIANLGRGLLFIDRVELVQLDRPVLVGARTPVNITNPSFDDTVPSSTGKNVPGWTLSSDAATRVFTEQVGGRWGGYVTDSTADVGNLMQIANGGSISQTLTEAFNYQADYELSMKISVRGKWEILYSGFTIRLWAGDTQIASINRTSTQVSALGRGWHDLTLYVNGQAHPDVTGNLKIEILNSDEGVNRTDAVHVDSVSLNKLTGSEANVVGNMTSINGLRV